MPEWCYVLIYILCGGIGGALGTVMKQGSLEIPHIKDRHIYCGSLYGVVCGSIAGVLGDGTWINSLISGIAGTTILAGLAKTDLSKPGPIVQVKRSDSDEVQV